MWGEGVDSKRMPLKAWGFHLLGKYMFIHVCLSTVSHSNIYIHSGTSHPIFFHALYQHFHLFLFYSTIIPTTQLVMYRLSQPLWLSNCFISQPQRRRRRRRAGEWDKSFFCLKDIYGCWDERVVYSEHTTPEAETGEPERRWNYPKCLLYMSHD